MFFNGNRRTAPKYLTKSVPYTLHHIFLPNYATHSRKTYLFQNRNKNWNVSKLHKRRLIEKIYYTFINSCKSHTYYRKDKDDITIIIIKYYVVVNLKSRLMIEDWRLIVFIFVAGFPKRLLVATSVLVIIAMVVMPSEARTLEHKIRHERRQHEALALTKETRMKIDNRMVDHRRRPHRKQSLLPQTKDTLGLMRLQKNVHADRFKNATKKIIKKLKNTRRFFNEERRVLNETREYRDGMPVWLPTINFVDIHFFNYKKRGATISERKVSIFLQWLIIHLKFFIWQ